MTSQARHIRLQLAREAGHPHGDPDAGFDIIAFLDEAGRLDPQACRDQGDRCRVRRFAQGDTVDAGRLRHTTGNLWILDFPGDRDDAVGFRLGDEHFVPGEYVSITAGDGVAHTYFIERVVDV